VFADVRPVRQIAETPTLIVNYGGPFGEDYFYESTNVHDDVKLNHFTPHRIIDEKNQTAWRMVPQGRVRNSRNLPRRWPSSSVLAGSSG